MNDLTPLPAPGTPPVLPSRYELGSMSTQQLRGALAQSLTLSAQHLAYLAAIWNELESRGEDLSELRTGLAVYLPQIAAGRLDAQAVVRFAGQPTVLRSIAGLTLDRQRQFAQGTPVKVLAAGADGTFTDAEIPVYQLTAAQARMVFDGDKIRSVAEQRARLESHRVKQLARVRPGAQNRVRYDPKADVVRIGRSAATVGEVTAALAEASRLRGVSAAAIKGRDDALGPVAVQLSQAEQAQLKVRAAEAGMSLQEYMRAVLMGGALL